MKVLVIAIALLGACDEGDTDKPEVKAAKLQCRELLKHIVAISPQSQGGDADKVASALPSEDIDGCVASEPEIRACMLGANDIDTVRKCLPSDEVLGCMHAVAGLKKSEHEKATEAKTNVDPARDAELDAIRAKCWAGDAKAADKLKTI